MGKLKPEKKPSWLERITFRYLETLIVKRPVNTDELQILNQKELRTIHFQTIKTLSLAAFFGVLGVLILYFPQYIWPNFFFSYHVYIEFIDLTVKIPVITTIYGTILVYIEIYALTWINVIAVNKISYVCGFPDPNDPNHKEYIKFLVDVGLEQTNKKMLTFGINPMQGLSKFRLLIYLTIEKFKATISNFIFKLLVKRFLGRFVLKYFVDMAGIPIFAFWNAYASFQVIKETKVRIMAPPLIRLLAKQIFEKHQKNEIFRELIYDTLQFIAASKRKFHHNHFILAKIFLETFNIPIKKHHIIKGDYIVKLQKQTPENRESILKLLLLGFLIDGKISFKEEKAIEHLNKKGILPFDYKTVSLWCKSFSTGRGLDEILNQTWNLK